MTQPNLKKLSGSDAEAWSYPYVEDDRPDDLQTTNAFNKRSEWKYEPPEPEEEILPPTAEEIEAIRAAAHSEGFESGLAEGRSQGHQEGYAAGKSEGFSEGHKEGLAQGLADAEQDITQQAQQWQQLVNELYNPVAKTHQEVERQLMLLAVSLAKSVIRTEVKVPSEIILTALREAISVLPVADQTIRIRLHPDDLAFVEQHFSPEQIAENHWHLIAAPELTIGGCEVMTQDNAVDHSIERRCKEVIDRFLLQHGLSDEQ
ncbi:flagellar assembly protein FliH [Alteromonas sp. ASW11-36]|uniref:Flagellar assembly protein FliH n=1 Tax=Alteromonas arenosi TaxID=3055817 RepID=A0ABT7SVA0_9ALTE|nr:flagellar assembly protein FliH [Alteromonas sp. ASW11-36]MDM7860124.1 flagellar assembly protein FliH [Alteromonas sp. ASW11-36]